MSTTTDGTVLPRRAAPTRAHAAARPAKQRHAGQILLHAAFIVACLATLFPLLWMLRTAFAPAQDVFRSTLSLWPDNATTSNFAAAFRLHPVGTWFTNSVVVAGAITLGKLAVAVPAGFAFGVMTFRGRDVAFALVVGTMTVPYVITLLPTYVAVASIGLYDSLTGVIVPTIGHCGFVVFFLRQAFKALPRELFEAAMAVLSFLGAWNLYLWPHLILDSTEHKTLSIGLKLFATTGEQGGEWGPLMATALLAALPVIALYLVVQRQLVAAFATSGIR